MSNRKMNRRYFEHNLISLFYMLIPYKEPIAAHMRSLPRAGSSSGALRFEAGWRSVKKPCAAGRRA
ncbi:hypothetical protein V8Z74_13885 [Comamonas sp. w2-DMI]|uniref:hypothetical protein n=1 Tax=Comamonas sp. w2-DMI TaxID=3126391 RepID=UPI0032E450AB